MLNNVNAQETIFIRRVCQDTVNNKNNTIYWSFNQDSCKIIGDLTLWGRDGSLASPFQIVNAGINPTNFETTHALMASSTWEYYIEATINCGTANKSYISKIVKVDNNNPSKTEIDSLSVDIKTNTPVIGWKRGLEGDIHKYEVYFTPNSGAGFMIGSTVQSAYMDLGGRNPKLSKLTYQITAVDSCGNRPATGLPHTTIFLKGQSDTCKMETLLTWENYRGWGTGIKTQIYQFRNDSFLLLGEVPFDTTRFIAECHERMNPCKYFIRSIKSNSPQVSSSSNLIESTPVYRLDTKAPVINFVTTDPISGNSAISISTQNTKDSSIVYSFRANGGLVGGQKTSGSSEINLGLLSGVQQFVAVSYGDCPTDSTASPTSNNIYLKLNGGLLEWNPYFTWNMGVEKYVISSFSGDYVPSMIDYKEVGYTKDTNYVVSSEPGVRLHCYYIEGIELGGSKTSKSNSVCVGKNSDEIYWPNVVRIGSGNSGLRFYGVGVVDETALKVSVYNRWGEEVYASTNEDFVGRDANGRDLDSGVYLFKAMVKQFNETKEITGTISIIR